LLEAIQLRAGGRTPGFPRHTENALGDAQRRVIRL
jgi:hypothetical protein